jgi:hypothetical protein
VPAFSLREVEGEAKRRLDPAIFDYFAGGADGEITLRANEAAFAASVFCLVYCVAQGSRNCSPQFSAPMFRCRS